MKEKIKEIKPDYDLTVVDDYKNHLYDKIDTKTQEIISEGFDFDSQTFSLSLPAQSNWTNIKSNKADFITLGMFPLQVSTKDSSTYFLQEIDVDNFYFTALSKVKNAYTSGSSLKKQVFDATTIEELDLVKDNR